MKDWPQSDLEAVSCPLCGPEVSQGLRHEFGQFRVVTCQQCGLIFLSPRLAEASILDLYRDQDYYDSAIVGQGYDEYLEVRENWLSTFRARLKEIGKYKPGGRVLDVGCGPGFFLEAAASLGYEAWGLDPSDYIVKMAARKFGERIRKGTIANTDFEPGFFDLVVAFDTFEHLYNPLQFLSAAHRLLKVDGVLAITTPNPESLLARISGKGWVSFKIPEHVYYWSPKTIRQALEKDFEVLEIRRAGQYATLGFLLRRLFKLKAKTKGFILVLLDFLNKISVYSDNGSITAIAKKSTPKSEEA